MNLSNALALNAKPTIVLNTADLRRSPNFQLSVDVEKATTTITLSEYFKAVADIQNNKLSVYYENADKEVYFIFHQGDGVSENSLSVDFFKGKRASIEIDGVKSVSNEIGLKSPRFKDAKTVSGQTIHDLLILQHPQIEGMLKLSGTFVAYKLEDVPNYQQSNITSVWTLELIGVKQQLDLFSDVVSPNSENETPLNVQYPLAITESHITPTSNTTQELVINFENAAPALNYTDSLTDQLLNGDEDMVENSSAYAEYVQ